MQHNLPFFSIPSSSTAIPRRVTTILGPEAGQIMLDSGMWEMDQPRNSKRVPQQTTDSRSYRQRFKIRIRDALLIKVMDFTPIAVAKEWDVVQKTIETT